MSKNKLAKFAEIATYPHVFEPPVGEEDFALRGMWGKEFFKNKYPIVLELGCGRGEYSLGLARLFPRKNFIGIDIKGARMYTGASESLQEGIRNVAFLRTRIEFIERYFAEDEVSEIWLTFPDPQMKKCSKRLTSSAFLSRYSRFLKPDGTIHVKTDSNFLFTYTRRLVEYNALPLLACSADLYCGDGQMGGFDERILGIPTYYETQWRARGITIKYLSFSLPRKANIVETNEEIELDNYRSFHRSKRSTLTKAM